MSAKRMFNMLVTLSLLMAAVPVVRMAVATTEVMSSGLAGAGSLADGWKPRAAEATSDTIWAVTWRATVHYYADTTDTNGTRWVRSSNIQMQGYAIVTVDLNWTTRAINVFQMTVEDDGQGEQTSGCFRIFDTSSIIDSDRWNGTVPPTPGFVIQPRKRPDGSYFMYQPLQSVGSPWPWMTYLHEHEYDNCGTKDPPLTWTQQAFEYGVIVNYPDYVPGQSEGKVLEGDSTGSFFSLQNQYTIPGSTPPMTVTWAMQVSRVPGRDLTVTRLEVTQTLQDVANSIPLVRGRRTVVRAYLGIGADHVPVPGVTGQLTAYSGATKLGSVLPFNPNGHISAPVTPDWHQIDHTLNFELDPAWMLKPSLHLVVKVNHDRSVYEINYDNNELAADVTTLTCDPRVIAYFPIHYTPPGGYNPADPSAHISVGQAFMRKVYPLAENGLIYQPWRGQPLTVNINVTGTVNAVLGDIAKLLLESSQPQPHHIYGWLPSLAFNGNGWGQEPGVAALGNDTESPNKWRRTFAHEIGHNFNLEHAAPGPGATTAGRHWFDVYDREIKPVPASVGGNDLLDLMVPDRLESEAWISPKNYQALMNQLCYPDVPAAVATRTKAATVGDNLLVTGMVISSTTPAGSIDPLYRSSTAPVHAPPTLPFVPHYCVKLKNGTSLLSQYCFDVNFDGDRATPASAMPFGMVVTYPLGLNRIDLTTGVGTLLNSRVASARPPTVTVTFPNVPGLTFTSTRVISWTGADPDGDPLTYNVLYSRDDGATWVGIGAGITGTSYIVDFSAMSGASTGLIKVQVSDGFNSAEDVSDSSFAVPNKGPTAAITSPPSGARFNAGAAVILQGIGLDLEDGSMGDSALRWTSDKDGVLGTGRLLETTLSSGLHTITLKVNDSGGLYNTTNIQVLVSGKVFLPLIMK